MKTLRIARNIAALFTLMMGLLASQQGLGMARAIKGSKGCVLGIRPGHHCTSDSSGNCHETRCAPGGICYNAGCN